MYKGLLQLLDQKNKKESREPTRGNVKRKLKEKRSSGKGETIERKLRDSKAVDK